MHRSFTALLLAACLGLGGAAALRAQEAARTRAAADKAAARNVAAGNLRRILTDRALWGKDFPTVLAQLQSWQRIGEKRVAVFPDRVVGDTAYSTREQAQPVVRRLTAAMGRPGLNPRAEFAALLRAASRQRPDASQVDAVPFLPEQESPHVTWTARSSQLVAPNLTVAEVRKRLGVPEEVIQETVHGRGEARPVVLTFHRYAGGAIAFVESDWAPDPGFVDRVLLNVPDVTDAVFQETK